MKHRFYQKSKRQQIKVQAIIAIGALLVVFSSIIIAYVSGLYWLAIIFFAIVLSLIAPFFDVPSGQKSGNLIYYSHLFICEKERRGVIKIHGGTLFDYIFVIEKKMTRKQRTSFIIQQYFEGLLKLIDTYEKDQNLNIKIKGTTYIFNKKTVEKIGFNVVKTDILQIIILVYNYLNLLISNSIAKSGLSFPNLNNTITFETDLARLIDRKATIIELNNRIQKSL